MAEETTSTASDQQLSQIINQLLVGRTAQPAVDPNTGPSSREGRGILSLLGEGLGGGSQYGTTAEREQGGLGALGALGARMLQGSDWSTTPHTFGSILGQGLDAARGNLGRAQAVSAAQHHAAQQLAHEQQQDQIARLKEALPYLQLQEEQRAAARQRGLLKPDSTNTDIGKAGTTTTSDALPATPELAPVVAPGGAKFQVAATAAEKFQGLVNDLEASGYNLDPATSGGYNKRFIAGTHTPSNHAFGTAIDINWAKNPRGGSASDIPPDLARQLAAKHGLVWGGDWSGKTRDPMHFEVPRPRADATPEAGAVQAAGGDVVPTGTVIPTLPPATAAASAADVADIKAGMVGAGADPDTLAPGPGSSPMAQPGAVVTAQAGGQQPSTTQLPPIKAGDGLITHPGTYSEYRAREYVPPPPTEDFNPNLTPAQQRAFASEAKAIEQRALAVSAARKPDEKSVQEILSAREEIKAKIQMAAQEKAQKAAIAITKYNETQDNAIRPRYEKEVDAYKAAAQANLAHSQAVDLARINADFDKDKEGARIAMRGDEKRMQDHATAAAAMQPVSDQLRQLPALMQNLPPGGSLSSLMGQYPQVTSLLERANIVSPGTADNVSIFMGLTNHLAGQLRVTGSGSMSDKDLASFKTVMPQLLQSPEGRAKAVAFLQNIADRVVEAQEFTDSYFKRIDPKTGKPAHDLVHLKDAINAPRRLDENGINQGGLGPVVPAAPKFEGPGSYAAAREWLKTNTQSGRPYTAWLPNEKGELTQQIMVAE